MDGRIHSAVVSGITMETRSVMVEWFERGEAKGKDIQLDLNQDLAPSCSISGDLSGKGEKYKPSGPVKRQVNTGLGSKRNPARQSHVITNNKLQAQQIEKMDI